jgi:hypothetical protein
MVRTKRSKIPVFTMGCNKSPFYKGKPKMFYFPLSPLGGQISLSPSVGDHQPSYFTNLRRKMLARIGKFFTLKSIIEIL